MSPIASIHDVPEQWWEQACGFTTQPLACVALDNRYVWVNKAFEELVGYSSTELRHRTWMDITIDADVGGDLASVEAVVKGNSPHYTMNKRYRHKFGYDVPVRLSVSRFPTNITEALVCFIVEAAPHVVHTNEMHHALAELETRIKEMERASGGTNIHIGDSTQGDKTGEGKITGNQNSQGMFVSVPLMAVVGVALLVLIGLLGYVAFSGVLSPPPSHIEEQE